MKVFISGKITGDNGYKEKFKRAEMRLKREGHIVLNPTVLPEAGFEHEEYLHICCAMIYVCDAVYMLDDWAESEGAKIERRFAMARGKEVMYEH